MRIPHFHIFEKLFREITPTFIGEIGTHNGESAIQFCRLACNLNRTDKIFYHGYDVFEEVANNKDFAKKERNAKGHGTLYTAEKRLKSLKLSENNRFKFKLFKGLTTDTLTPIKFDFVYIDGGHSYDTVVHDWNKVKESKLIVFDDTKLKSVRSAIEEHVEPNYKVEYTTRTTDTRGLAIVRNYG